MGEALAGLIDDRLTSGLVVVPGPVAGVRSRLEYLEASHPVPDARSVEAGRRVLEIASGAGEKDLLFVCISGGGSSLLTLPAEGISLDRKRRLADDLMRAGATIRELNIVRKHLSAIKGGQLARAAHPATVVTLAISDVVGDDPGTIASGPTHWDASTFAEARAILECYGLWDSASALVRARFEEGERGQVEETLKEGDPVFERVHTFVVGDNMTALRAAKREAEKRGFEPIFLSSSDSGEARKTAAGYAAFLAELACSAPSLPRPLCLLAGGELTVTVKGRGRGGRNTEFVLASLHEMEKAGVAGPRLAHPEPGHGRHRRPDRRRGGLGRPPDGQHGPGPRPRSRGLPRRQRFLRILQADGEPDRDRPDRHERHGPARLPAARRLTATCRSRPRPTSRRCPGRARPRGR